MSSGAYVALSGLQARADQLDRLASDLANSGTSGYKAERSTTAEADRAPDPFGIALQSAIDVADGPRVIDFKAGAHATTGRDLDVAIDGPGFFVVSTPAGPRYTRNGHFTRRADGVLATEDGNAVLGADGPITLPPNGTPVKVGSDGSIMSGETVVGRPQVVNFTSYDGLAREDGALFRASPGMQAQPVQTVQVTSGVLEQSNVSVVERMAQLTEVTRSFEALQRGITILMNDLDGRAITDLGRR